MQEKDANAPTNEDNDSDKQKQFLKTVYNVMDLDGDGKLSKLELQAACNAVPTHTNPPNYPTIHCAIGMIFVYHGISDCFHRLARSTLKYCHYLDSTTSISAVDSESRVTSSDSRVVLQTHARVLRTLGSECQSKDHDSAAVLSNLVWCRLLIISSPAR